MPKRVSLHRGSLSQNQSQSQSANPYIGGYFLKIRIFQKIFKILEFKKILVKNDIFWTAKNFGQKINYAVWSRPTRNKIIDSFIFLRMETFF